MRNRREYSATVLLGLLSALAISLATALTDFLNKCLHGGK